MPESTKPSILVLAAGEPENGGGHLTRSMLLVKDLRKAGATAYVFPVEGVVHTRFRQLCTQYMFPEEEKPEERSWTFLVLDAFRSSAAAYERWSKLAPLVGLDEGGPFRSRFDFLIDILPNLERKNPPNCLVPLWLQVPQQRKPLFAYTGKRVLVSFGTEDAAGLSVPAACSLAEQGFLVDVVFGPLCSGVAEKKKVLEQYPGLRILAPRDDLKETLFCYDLLITHFGLGAFEALYARVPVLLVHPGSYHQKLSRHAALYSCGTGPKAASKAGQCFSSDAQIILEKSKALAERYFTHEQQKSSMAETLLGWNFLYARTCPLCGSARKGAVLERFEEKSYKRCPSCSIIYMQRPALPHINYNQDYFFKDYKNQYGKTYIEDFPKLQKMAGRRIDIIDTIRKKQKKNITNKAALLDIGCAYGPFLAVAKARAYQCTGIEAAEAAARYVQESLEIPVLKGLFPQAAGQLPPESFSVVTLWYVIEHFPDPASALATAARLLEPDGIFAFSTPSASGISARKDRRLFLKQSPEDHWTLWEPGRTSALLARFGFRLVHIAGSGHHPERFPLIGPWLSRHTGFIPRLMYRFLYAVSRIFCLGDTYEVYAVKKGG